MEQHSYKPPSYEQWRAGFNRTLIELEQQYTTRDTENITMGSFAGFAHQALENPDFEYYVKVVHDAHPRIAPKIAFNLLLRGFQDDRLSHDPDYPYGYENTAKWSEAFDDISDDVIREGVLELNLRQHLLSNVSERYKTIPLLIHLMEDRFKDNPSVLDLGCSQMHGGKKLAFKETLDSPYGEFKSVDMMRRFPSGLKVNKHLSRAANFIINQNISYGQMAGVDIRDIDDTATRRFAKSCSFYPDELRNKDKVAQYEALETLDPNHERVHFYKADISSDTEARYFRTVANTNRYDIIIFSTVLYQATPAEQMAMKINAMNMLSDDGILIIQDAPNGDFTTKYNYVTSVIDSRHIEKGEQPLLRWATGRCLRVVPEAGRIAFKASGFQTITERLLEIQQA